MPPSTLQADASTSDGFVAAVDRHMLDLLAGRSGAVADAARGPIEAGGKRLRPLLVRAACPTGIDRDAAERFLQLAVPAASAVELVHTASLVHDDLLDGADVRRGIPTIDAVAGRDVAVAAGDLLFSLAFATLVACREIAGDVRTRDAVRILAEASRALAEGEALQARQLRDPSLSVDAYLERCAGKTGVLFAAALQLGATFGGAQPQDVALLGRFGRTVGVAFQLADDILDCGPPEAEAVLGKRPGADLRDGTITLPMLHAARVDPSLAERLAAPVEPGDVESVLDRIRCAGGLDAASVDARALRADAEAMLDALDDRHDVATLARVAAKSVDRIR